MLYIDPSSYGRYNRYAEAVSALDARGTARLYATLKPRVRDAYRRLEEDFDPVLERAIVELLRQTTGRCQRELQDRLLVWLVWLAFARENSRR
jgi:hypothetical protein